MTPELIQRWMGYFDRRRRNYQMTFTSPPGRQVMADLMDFCCAETTTDTGEPHGMAIREGRRQVWNRIYRALSLTPEEQFNLATQKDKP